MQVTEAVIAHLAPPLWSQPVLDEATDALGHVRPAELAGMHRRVAAMNAHFPDALVQGWESLVTGIVLPDPDDRHVVAAALRGGADCILTHNFPGLPSRRGTCRKSLITTVLYESRKRSRPHRDDPSDLRFLGALGGIRTPNLLIRGLMRAVRGRPPQTMRCRGSRRSEGVWRPMRYDTVQVRPTAF
jgi:predicted nucleic acid-binding protein